MTSIDRSPAPTSIAGGVRMARIEVVLHLQNIRLFRFCAAEEIVRLAGIATAREFAPGELLYQRDDVPRSLYCLVEGEVELIGESGAAERRGVGEAFGVLDILSGRRRQRSAKAVTDAVVLVIAAEDFFDLLAHNIEIVKALFREVLDERGAD